MRRQIFTLLFSLFLGVAFSQTPPARTWHKNKTVKERWGEDSQGAKHGTYIRYFEDGEREMVGNYTHGKRNGQWEITVYSSLSFQQIKSVTTTNLVNGALHGLYKTMVGEKVLIQGYYTNGVKTGYLEEYDTDEQIYSEGNYVNDKRDGEWKNTLTSVKSESEKGIGVLTGNLGAEKTETKKGYKTIYKADKAIACYDDKGVNVMEKGIRDNVAQKDFEKCTSIDDYNQFIDKYSKQYPTLAIRAKQRIDDIKAIARRKEEDKQEEKALLNSLISSWNNLESSKKTKSFFDDYFKRYPNADRQPIEKLVEEQERVTNRNGLLNCKDDAHCLYPYLLTNISDEAETKIKELGNRLLSDGKGSTTLDLLLAIEIKEKFGFNIYKYLNFDGRFPTSYEFINEYPNISDRTNFNSLYKIDEKLKPYSLHYEIRSGKLKKLKYALKNGSACIFEFHENGKIKTFTERFFDGNVTKNFILEFNEIGKIYSWNCNILKDYFEQ